MVMEGGSLGGGEVVERVRTERVKWGMRARRRGGPRLPVAWGGVRGGGGGGLGEGTYAD